MSSSASWVDPATSAIAGLDLYDPTLMILHTSPILTGATASEIEQKLKGILAKKSQLDEAGLQRLQPHFEAWSARVATALEPVAKTRLKHYSYAQGLLFGEATVELLTNVLAEGALAEDPRARLMQDDAWYVPRIVAP